MMEPCFNYFSIDVGDIWEYETRLFLDSGSNEQLVEIALEKVRTKIIERARPSVTYDGSQHDEDSIRYYSSKIERFLAATHLKAQVSLGYFVSRDDLYQYGHPISIEKEDRDFDYWFALKLRQYDSGLKYLNDFLTSHLENNFSNDKSEYDIFLDLVLRQYKDLPISKKVSKQVKRYIKSDSKFEKKKIVVSKNRPRSSAVFHAFTLTALRTNRRYFITHKHELKEVFTDLMDHSFIKEKSSFATFENVFSNQKVAKDKRLVWVGGFIYLKLFVRYLLDKQKIEPVGNNHWVIVTQCFVDRNGSELDIIKVSKANGGIKDRVEKLEWILKTL